MLRSHEYRALLRVSETRLLRHATYERNGRKLEMFAIRRGDQTIDCWAREDGSGQEEGQLCSLGADVPDGDVQIVAAIDRSFDRFRKAFDQETNAPRRKRTKRDDELENALLGPPVSEQVAFDHFRFVERASLAYCPLKAHYREALSRVDSRPEATQSAAVSLQLPRTTALCFDRVWGLPGDMPEEIRFSGSSESEQIFLATLVPQEGLSRTSDPRGLSLTHPGVTFALELPPDDVATALSRFELAAATSPSDLRALEDTVARYLASGPAQQLRRSVVPIYPTSTAQAAAFSVGNRAVLVSAIRGVGVVEEGALSWDQVLQFRADKRSRSNLRKLVHWLDANFAGKTESFIVDELGLKLDRYHTAIHKHGIKTKTGILSSLLDPRVGTALGTLGGAVALGFPELYGVLAAGGVVLGKAIAWISETKIDRIGIEDQFAEVAFVAQVEELGKEAAGRPRRRTRSRGQA